MGPASWTIGSLPPTSKYLSVTHSNFTVTIKWVRKKYFNHINRPPSFLSLPPTLSTTHFPFLRRAIYHTIRVWRASSGARLVTTTNANFNQHQDRTNESFCRHDVSCLMPFKLSSRVKPRCEETSQFPITSIPLLSLLWLLSLKLQHGLYHLRPCLPLQSLLQLCLSFLSQQR
jgi:hypothetical protein